MAGKMRHLLERDGRFYARLVVKPDLRPFLDGKSELRTPLGGDRRQALSRHAREVAILQDRLMDAESRKVRSEGKVVARSVRASAPMSDDALARHHYQSLLSIDDEARNDQRWTALPIDDLFVDKLRDAVAGKASNRELCEIVGTAFDRYQTRGNIDALPGSLEWRRVARVLASAEFEALSRVAERDEGDFVGVPDMPALKVAEPEPKAPYTFDQIIDEEVRRRTSGKDPVGVRPHTIAQFRRTAASFAKHRKSTDATNATRAEGEAWVQHLLSEGRLANKTIGVALVDLRAVLNWAKRHRPDDMPEVNALTGVQKPAVRAIPPEARTFTLDEAHTILKAAQAESNPTLRFVPWIAAYSGARVSEIANLLPEDFFQIGDDWFFRITITGGRTVKTFSSIRRVPVHRDLIAHGLIEHVQASTPGKRLFNKHAQPRISEWITNKVKVKREHMAPNHSWRHLFEDICTLAGMPDDARAYLTGRATGTSRDRYGRSDVALPGLAREMAKVPAILSLDAHSQVLNPSSALIPSQ